MIPVLDDAEHLARLLTMLAPWRAAGDELIVVDGGSSDDSATVAAAHATRVLLAPRGRARQMNAGARAARGELLWFVHADAAIAAGTRAVLLAANRGSQGWGRFDIAITDPATPFRVIETLMNLRSRLSGIATGDQALFVRRELFVAVGGFPDLALMEDIELSRILKRHCRPQCLAVRVGTSARRWRRDGIARTVVMMWLLRLAWFVGVPATRLARIYGYR